MEMTAKEIERFLTKIARSEDQSGCWLWAAATDPQGYGRFSRERRGGTQRNTNEHRFSYQLFVGPIPEGLELDHLCHNRDTGCPGNECLHRRCVNPAHLEPVTHAENCRRGRSPFPLVIRREQCIRGHLFDEGNTYVRTDGRRACRECNRESVRRYQARKKELRQLTSPLP